MLRCPADKTAQSNLEGLASSELRQRKIDRLTTFDAPSGMPVNAITSQNIFRVAIASPEDGRPALVKLTKLLSTQAKCGQFSSDNVSEGLIHEVFSRMFRICAPYLPGSAS
jgi:hypothetical protein